MAVTTVLPALRGGRAALPEGISRRRNAGRTVRGPVTRLRVSTDWDVEIHTLDGGIVRGRVAGRGPREAVESALATAALRPEVVGGISAAPAALAA
jgi:hypothetical protein